MTREEAIRILDPETTGEAMSEIEYYGGFSGRAAVVQAVLDACVLAVAALREQKELGNKVEAKGVEIDPVNYATKTNADRIRSMSDEELSEFINALTVCDCCVYDGKCTEHNNIQKCREGVLEWLQKPEKEK